LNFVIDYKIFNLPAYGLAELNLCNKL